MRLIGAGIKALENVSPLGFMVLGGALALGLAPIAKKTARRTAVLTARGILTIGSIITETARKIQEGVCDLVNEARYEQEYTAMEREEKKQNVYDLMDESENISHPLVETRIDNDDEE